MDVAGLAGRMNSLAAAGGIGGLLAVQDAGASQDYVYFHDALGSVGQVLDLAAATAGAAMVAKYEYDPCGNQTNVAGGYDQPFRFSGKYHDAETGLGYWGYRYYNPVLGRWINRDPLGEDGGMHLYCYVTNGAASRLDALGLLPWCLPSSPCATSSSAALMPAELDRTSEQWTGDVAGLPGPGGGVSDHFPASGAEEAAPGRIVGCFSTCSSPSGCTRTLTWGCPEKGGMTVHCDYGWFEWRDNCCTLYDNGGQRCRYTTTPTR